MITLILLIAEYKCSRNRKEAEGSQSDQERCSLNTKPLKYGYDISCKQTFTLPLTKKNSKRVHKDHIIDERIKIKNFKTDRRNLENDQRMDTEIKNYESYDQKIMDHDDGRMDYDKTKKSMINSSQDVIVRNMDETFLCTKYGTFIYGKKLIGGKFYYDKELNVYRRMYRDKACQRKEVKESSNTTKEAHVGRSDDHGATQSLQKCLNGDYEVVENPSEKLIKEVDESQNSQDVNNSLLLIEKDSNVISFQLDKEDINFKESTEILLSFSGSSEEELNEHAGLKQLFDQGSSVVQYESLEKIISKNELNEEEGHATVELTTKDGLQVQGNINVKDNKIKKSCIDNVDRPSSLVNETVSSKETLAEVLGPSVEKAGVTKNSLMSEVQPDKSTNNNCESSLNRSVIAAEEDKNNGLSGLFTESEKDLIHEKLNQPFISGIHSERLLESVQLQIQEPIGFDEEEETIEQLNEDSICISENDKRRGVMNQKDISSENLLSPIKEVKALKPCDSDDFCKSLLILVKNLLNNFYLRSYFYKDLYVKYISMKKTSSFVKIKRSLNKRKARESFCGTKVSQKEAKSAIDGILLIDVLRKLYYTIKKDDEDSGVQGNKKSKIIKKYKIECFGEFNGFEKCFGDDFKSVIFNINGKDVNICEYVLLWLLEYVRENHYSQIKN